MLKGLCPKASDASPVLISPSADSSTADFLSKSLDPTIGLWDCQGEFAHHGGNRIFIDPNVRGQKCGIFSLKFDTWIPPKKTGDIGDINHI